MTKLNLGCGEVHLDGYVNVDLYCGADMTLDLFQLPWPWESSSVDEVACHHFIEHVPRFRDTWRELHRILKPGGRLWIRVPHFRSPQAAWPEQHRHQFSLFTFTWLLTQGHKYDIGEALFETAKLRHNFRSKLCFLSPLANIHPSAWEWFGMPVSDIEWIGRKI